jgi:hypothetical protein
MRDGELQKESKMEDSSRSLVLEEEMLGSR